MRVAPHLFLPIESDEEMGVESTQRGPIERTWLGAQAEGDVEHVDAPSRHEQRAAPAQQTRARTSVGLCVSVRAACGGGSMCMQARLEALAAHSGMSVSLCETCSTEHTQWTWPRARVSAQ
jgi:hypothetical protein